MANKKALGCAIFMVLPALILLFITIFSLQPFASSSFVWRRICLGLVVIIILGAVFYEFVKTLDDRQ